MYGPLLGFSEIFCPAKFSPSTVGAVRPMALSVPVVW
jgi:hypothetical protein